VGRALSPFDLRLVDPHEVRTIEIPVPAFHLYPIAHGGAGRSTRIRDCLPLDLLAEHRAVAGERESLHVPWPEVAEPVGEDQHQQSRDQQQADSEHCSRKPHEWVAASPERSHSVRYFCRSLCRTSSAAVLTRNVMTKSSNAATNSTRNKVPP